VDQLTRMVTITLSPQGFEVKFEGAMWGRKYIDQAHRALLRRLPRYLAEVRGQHISDANKKGEVKDDRGSEGPGDSRGAEQGITDGGTGEELIDRVDGKERGVDEVNGGEAITGAVQRDPGPDGGTGQDDREVDELLEKGELIERPRHRRASSRRA
jgi:hypothetical protein